MERMERMERMEKAFLVRERKICDLSAVFGFVICYLKQIIQSFSLTFKLVVP
jgi:hypothetical protein